ncbi:hypothetical protein C3B61_18505 [Cryobacterium zongtaii]|uniref:Uncharacterized protein n=1 Tax=Cryobacterium zongtaii TaxID=1259217 RepID=A0A2S3Z9F0_9MICO|nr:hypothetical protein C3B61_18505 [Cryobacterium zongtaii]
MVQRKLGDVGRRIGLIRWLREGEEWLPEIVVGTVIDRASGVWHLDVNGETRVLNECDWSMYQP